MIHIESLPEGGAANQKVELKGSTAELISDLVGLLSALESDEKTMPVLAIALYVIREAHESGESLTETVRTVDLSRRKEYEA